MGEIYPGGGEREPIRVHEAVMAEGDEVRAEASLSLLCLQQAIALTPVDSRVVLRFVPESKGAIGAPQASERMSQAGHRRAVNPFLDPRTALGCNIGVRPCRLIRNESLSDQLSVGSTPCGGTDSCRSRLQSRTYHAEVTASLDPVRDAREEHVAETLGIRVKPQWVDWRGVSLDRRVRRPQQAAGAGRALDAHG